MKGFLKKAFNDKNRKKTIGILCSIIAIIILIVVILVSNSLTFKNKKVEKHLSVRLEEIGKTFYEKFYNQLGSTDEERSNKIKDYTYEGIIIDLENLAITNFNEKQAILDEFKNAAGVSCDVNKTMVSIYPKEPYGIHDYDIVIGPIADDGVVLQLTNYREGIYSPEQVAQMLQDRFLDQQYFFGTERALKFLKKIKAEIL